MYIYMYEENIGKACNDAFNRRSRTEIRPISIYLSPRPSPKLDDNVTKKRGRDENDPVPYNIYIYMYIESNIIGTGKLPIF